MKSILLILLFSGYAHAQQLSSFVEFELETNDYRHIDSLVNKEFAKITPVVKNQARKFSLQISGYSLEYIIDVFYNEYDTTAFITTYTYSIEDLRRTRRDRRRFKGFKLKKKSFWKLIHKTTELDSVLSRQLADQISIIDIDQLPTWESLNNKYGIFFDGIFYSLSHFQIDYPNLYEVGSGHIEHIPEFSKILSIFDEIRTKKDYKINFESKRCHSTRTSAMYVCKIE